MIVLPHGADLRAYLRFSHPVGRRDPRETNLALKAEEPPCTHRAYRPDAQHFMTMLGIATPAELR